MKTQITVERDEESQYVGQIVETTFHKLPNPVRISRFVDDDSGRYFVACERDGTDWHVKPSDVLATLGNNWDTIPA